MEMSMVAWNKKEENNWYISYIDDEQYKRIEDSKIDTAIHQYS